MSLSNADDVRKAGERRSGTTYGESEVLHSENDKRSTIPRRDGTEVSLAIPEEHTNNLPVINTNFGTSGESEEISSVEPPTGPSGLELGTPSRQDSSTPKQKINISYIGDNRKRQVSFCKRKNGAMKKGRELVRWFI